MTARHEPLKGAAGLPYFRAEVREGREYGRCPRCGELILRTPGAFARHWNAASAAEEPR